MNLTSLIPILATLLAAAPVPQDPASLATATAEYRVVPREYRLDGVVEAVRRTTVSAQTQGQVQEILYDVDDFVTRNAVLVRLKDTEHRSRLTQAEAELKSATADLEQARDEHARVKGLHERQLVSDSAMDAAATALKGAQARFEAAVAGVEQAQEQLEYTQIRAPYSGIVTHRHVELGEVASPGQPVMSGISLDELRVIVDVPQSLIPAVREGGEVRVYPADGSVLTPKNITIFPFADLGSNTFKVRVDLAEGTKSLFPGMFVKTGFAIGERRELVIPAQAVVYRSEVTGVYVLGADNRLQFRQIRAGRAFDDQIVVLAGLSEGERVALDPVAAGASLKAQAARGSHDG